MVEPSFAVRVPALTVLVSLLVNTASVFAQAAPPAAPPPAQAPPPAGYQAPAAQPAYPPQQPQPQQYQQPAPAQGAPAPQGSFQPAPTPLYPQTQQGYAPPPGYQQPPGYPQQQRPWQPPRPPRPRKALMITGISILGGSYLISTAVGASLLDEENFDDIDNDGDYDDCRDCDDIAPWLFVPVVGPFIAMSETRDDDGWLWMLGMLQVVGTGLTIGGIIQYKNSKRAAEAQGYTHWKLGGNRELALDISTTSRFAGPRMRLSF